MKQHFLTHFTSVVIAHFLILISGITLIKGQMISDRLNEGALTIQIAKGVLFPTNPNATGTEVVRPKVAAIAPKKKTNSPVAPRAAQMNLPQEERAPVAATGEAGAGGPGLGIESGTVGGTRIKDLKVLYKAELRAQIDKNKFYPSIAKRLGQEGQPVVSFRLLADGNITDIRIKKSSSNDRLDEAALSAVKAVKKFHPLPDEFGEKELAFEIPVSFRLL